MKRAFILWGSHSISNILAALRVQLRRGLQKSCDGQNAGGSITQNALFIQLFPMTAEDLRSECFTVHLTQAMRQRNNLEKKNLLSK